MCGTPPTYRSGGCRPVCEGPILKEILDKITSYNLFNYLLPGVVFAVLATKLTHFTIVQQDVVVGGFIYYFIGMVISRLGSLVLEPFLKWLKFIQFSEYKDFVEACKSDSKIEVLSEANNSYRTLAAVFASLLLLKGYEKIEAMVPVLTNRGALAAVLLLFVMFLFSYRKQTSYITGRIATQTERGKAAKA